MKVTGVSRTLHTNPAAFRWHSEYMLASGDALAGQTAFRDWPQWPKLMRLVNNDLQKSDSTRGQR